MNAGSSPVAGMVGTAVGSGAARVVLGSGMVVSGLPDGTTGAPSGVVTVGGADSGETGTSPGAGTEP